MASERYEPDFEVAGSATKKYFLASRALMEALLRPYGLGNTQWYVLSLLVHEGPITQRELTSRLEVERATLSGVVAALVRKDLVVQMPNAEDQRQKTLQITAAGERLWESLPDPAQVIADTAFAGVDVADVATMNRVLREATQRLVDHREGKNRFMTILVTGGTGLVGSRLLRRFAEAGIECRGLVRAGGDLPDGVEAVVGDILDVASLAEAVDGVETIVHLAALFRTTDDDGIWRVNLEGTRNLIAATRGRAHHARFILASTSNIYDFGAPRPGRETDDVHPTLAYPASKAAAETELKNSGLTWAVVRLPFVYGDGDGHLEAFRGASMHPAQRFSVMHHQDIAAAFRLALTGAMDGQVVNVADEAPATVYELAAICGYEYPPSAEPLTNPWRGQVDVSLARSLGFRPTIPTIHEAARLGRI